MVAVHTLNRRATSRTARRNFPPWLSLNFVGKIWANPRGLPGTTGMDRYDFSLVTCRKDTDGDPGGLTATTGLDIFEAAGRRFDSSRAHQTSPPASRPFSAAL